MYSLEVTLTELKVVHALGKLDSSNNTLSYPDSKYENLRNGFPSE